MLISRFFKGKNIAEKAVPGNILSENLSLINSLETAVLLAHNEIPIHSNIICYETAAGGYVVDNTTLGASYHYLNFSQKIISGSCVIDAPSDNHFKFYVGKSGRYLITINLRLTIPETAGSAAGERMYIYYPLIGISSLQVSLIRNGTPETRAFYGDISVYDTVNNIFAYKTISTITGTNLYNLTAGDFIEPIINLKDVGLAEVSFFKFEGSINIIYLDNEGIE